MKILDNIPDTLGYIVQKTEASNVNWICGEYSKFQFKLRQQCDSDAIAI